MHTVMAVKQLQAEVAAAHCGGKQSKEDRPWHIMAGKQLKVAKVLLIMAGIQLEVVMDAAHNGGKTIGS